MILNLNDAAEVLSRYAPRTEPAGNYKLDRMLKLMAALGNPQDKLRVIHVAGTSGKTSTTYFITALLREAGMMVGTTVSPHVAGINERAMIDGKPLQEELFCYYLDKFIHLVKDAKIEPTYFELLVAFAYWVFAREEVDYAVIETGLGGLLDGTNVVSREDKVCVITDIGLDHTQVLGDTLELIAAQKAGIIHKGNHVMVLPQKAEIAQVILQRCKDQGALLHTVHVQEEMPVWLQNLPMYQQRNFSLALATFALIAQRDELSDVTLGGLDRAAHIVIPGRMERIQTGGKTVILDGAHNPQKMQALAESVKEQYPDRKMDVLLGIVQRKNYENIVDYLKQITGHVICTHFDEQQDMYRHAADPKKLAALIREGNIGADVVEDLNEAVETLMRSKSDVVLVTGSLFLIKQVRALLLPAPKTEGVEL